LTTTTARRVRRAWGGRLSRLPIFWSAWSILFVLMALWSVATPLMASPDEPAHVIRAAAVVRGEFVGNPSTRVPGSTDVTVPKYVADANNYPACYAFRSEVSARCEPWPSHDDREVSSTTTATLNSPVFYALTGLPSLVLDGAPALYAMRLVVALITSGLLAIAFAALSGFASRRFATIGMALGVTPMVLFLGGTVNPNAVEAAGAAGALATLLLIFRTDSPGRILWTRLTMLVVSIFFLCNTRSISLAWLLVITAVAVLMSQWRIFLAVFRRPASWVAVGLIAIIVATVGVYFIIPKGLTQVANATGIGSGATDAFLTVLDRTFDYGAGWVGIFGWLDTPPPGALPIIWSVLLGGLILCAVVLARGRLRLGLIAWLVVFFLVPPITQAGLVHEWGYVWQGRYTLALFVGLGIIAGVALDERFPEIDFAPYRRLLITGIVLGGFGQVLAFAWALKRYVVGIAFQQSWYDMLVRPQWEPPLHWLVLTVLFAAAIAVAGWALYSDVTGLDRVRPAAALRSPERASSEPVDADPITDPTRATAERRG
jgi:hypothetical protein